MLTKICSKCDQDKPISDFHFRKISDNSRFGYCKPCRLAKDAGYRRSNPVLIHRINRKSAKKCVTPERVRNRNLKNRFGLSIDDYNRMLQQQNNCCAICQTTTPRGRFNSFCIDHDHKTGRVRGLLCFKCNLGLGNFNDQTELLLKAKDYLEKT